MTAETNEMTLVTEPTPGNTKSSDGRARPGPRSRVRHDARLAEIVDITTSLFASQGYHGTSIQDISDATGLQRGALYHYIKGKKELLFRIHERFIEPLLAEARSIEADQLPPDEALRALARALMRDIDMYRNQVTVFLHEWKVIKDDPDAQAVREARREFEEIIERVLVRGRDDGTFAIRDAHLDKFAFLGMINYTYQWYTPGGRYDAERVATDFADIFLNGILKTD